MVFVDMKPITAVDYRGRKERALSALSKVRSDALLITHLPNVLYLCGFTGSSGVLACSGDKWGFFTDGRYKQQAGQEVEGARVRIIDGPPLLAAADWIRRSKRKSVAIEAAHMSISEGSRLAAQLSRGVRIRKTTGFVEGLRLVKDDHEIRCIRKSVHLGTALLQVAIDVLRSGTTEAAVAAEIEYRARQLGASGMSFDTIVAGGPRSALPHARALNEPIPRKGFVVMDFGVILAHYCSDMTRTVCVGRPTSADRHLYSAVLDAQMAAIAAVRPGVEVGEVDKAARTVLRRAGLAKFFTHSTGHGVGLEIHEAPRVGRGAKDLLKPGMVITIEPGAYVPGCGGVRIEDMVLVTEHGCEVLTKAPKELIVV